MCTAIGLLAAAASNAHPRALACAECEGFWSSLSHTCSSTFPQLRLSCLSCVHYIPHVASTAHRPSHYNQQHTRIEVCKNVRPQTSRQAPFHPKPTPNPHLIPHTSCKGAAMEPISAPHKQTRGWIFSEMHENRHQGKDQCRCGRGEERGERREGRGERGEGGEQAHRAPSSRPPTARCRSCVHTLFHA